jgi:hypothetical protein
MARAARPGPSVFTERRNAILAIPAYAVGGTAEVCLDCRGAASSRAFRRTEQSVRACIERLILFG